jgi:hypothetical protein
MVDHWSCVSPESRSERGYGYDLEAARRGGACWEMWRAVWGDGYGPGCTISVTMIVRDCQELFDMGMLEGSWFLEVRI